MTGRATHLAGARPNLTACGRAGSTFMVVRAPRFDQVNCVVCRGTDAFKAARAHLRAGLGKDAPALAVRLQPPLPLYGQAQPEALALPPTSTKPP